LIHPHHRKGGYLNHVGANDSQRCESPQNRFQLAGSPTTGFRAASAGGETGLCLFVSISNGKRRKGRELFTQDIDVDAEIHELVSNNFFDTVDHAVDTDYIDICGVNKIRKDLII
jgi:hypothetical protein